MEHDATSGIGDDRFGLHKQVVCKFCGGPAEMVGLVARFPRANRGRASRRPDGRTRVRSYHQKLQRQCVIGTAMSNTKLCWSMRKTRVSVVSTITVECGNYDTLRIRHQTMRKIGRRIC